MAKRSVNSRRKSSLQGRKSASTVHSPGRSPDLPVLILAALGMAITAYLTGVSWWEAAPAFCSAGSGCDVIQHSRWSSILGLPLALWGFALYAVIAVVAYRPMSRLKRWKRLWSPALAGVAISLYLTLVGLIALNALCIWCLASLVIISAIFATLIVRRPPSAPDVPWSNWLLNSGILVVVVIGALHAYYNYNDLLRPPQDPRLEALALHLDESGAQYYGAFWCTNCQEQRRLFGDAANALPYTECSPNGRGSQPAFACLDQGIESYPTWIIGGERIVGVLKPEELARRTGFDWETTPKE